MGPAVESENMKSARSTKVRGDLEKSLGTEIRRYREKLNIGCTELAHMAGISAGMLSRIENGLISPSIGTLETLAKVLRQPIGALFREFDRARPATLTKAGKGKLTNGNRERCGHSELLGIGPPGPIVFEPLMITIQDKSGPLPEGPQRGVGFVFVVEGHLEYTHGERHYPLNPGDALLFDASGANAIARVTSFPTRLLIIAARLRD